MKLNKMIHYLEFLRDTYDMGEAEVGIDIYSEKDTFGDNLFDIDDMGIDSTNPSGDRIFISINGNVIDFV